MPVNTASLGTPLQGLRRATVSGWIRPSAHDWDHCSEHAAALSGSHRRSSRALSDAIVYAERADRYRELVALLDEVQLTKEALRAKYGEFDVDAEIHALRRERVESLDEQWRQ